jgi:hypothetical protein
LVIEGCRDHIGQLGKEALLRFGKVIAQRPRSGLGLGAGAGPSLQSLFARVVGRGVIRGHAGIGCMAM